jgi:hypothetical protein
MADSMKVDALTLTNRMKDMGVVGMRPHGGLWFASFESDPAFEHVLPPPVAEWLLGADEADGR